MWRALTNSKIWLIFGKKYVALQGKVWHEHSKEYKEKVGTNAKQSINFERGNKLIRLKTE